MSKSISVTLLSKVLEEAMKDNQKLEAEMNSLDLVGVTSVHWTGFQLGVYNAFKDDPKRACHMSALAGFVFGYNYRKMEEQNESE